MHQHIPSKKSICWCSKIRKYCIWISTKGTLKFSWFLLSLACVVKEGEFLLSYLSEICLRRRVFYVIPSQREITERGRVCYLIEKIVQKKKGTCLQISFYYDMLCCHQCQRERLLDTIINCVLSLMLHKFHFSH